MLLLYIMNITHRNYSEAGGDFALQIESVGKLAALRIGGWGVGRGFRGGHLAGGVGLLLRGGLLGAK